VPTSFFRWSLAALLTAGVVACASGSGSDAASTSSGASGAAGRIARIETAKGTIRFKLYDKEAPITAGNFAGLAEKGFYNGLTFHRVEPGFVVQGGDPNGNGTGGSGKTIPLEIAPGLKHDGPGVVSMARSQDPNSASSQFFITLGAAPHLDGGYAIFGRVIEGQEVVDKLQVGDKMDKVTIEGGNAGAPAAGSAVTGSDAATK
jgi:cyclophilin family peptidyl-prolyl cis-trans isomerase